MTVYNIVCIQPLHMKTCCMLNMIDAMCYMLSARCYMLCAIFYMCYMLFGIYGIDAV